MTGREIQKADLGSGSSGGFRGGGEPSTGQQFDLWYYVGVLRRYWWLILLTTTVCVGAAWWAQRDNVPEYTAEVLLQQREEAPVTSEIKQRLGGANQNFGSQVEIIRSRAVLAPVVDSVGLQLRIADKENRSHFTELVGSLKMLRRDTPRGRFTVDVQPDSVLLRQVGSGAVVARAAKGEPLETTSFSLTVGSPDVLPTDPPVEFYLVDREVAVNSLQGSLEIEEGKGPDLVWVRYTSADPELSAQVVNSVGRAYQKFRAQTARKVAQRRRSVISEQLVDLADSLREEQDKLMQYQREAEALDPSAQSGALMDQRFQLENQLQELRYQESLLEGVVAGLNSDTGGDQSFQRLLSTASGIVEGLSSLQTRLQELRSRRQELTASRYGLTENNPRVQVVDSQIASTKEDIRVAIEEGLDRLRRRIDQTEQRLAQIRNEVQTVPSKTAQYSRLEQRVSAVQEVFDQLVEKYYEAQIAEGVETGGIELVAEAPVPLGPDPTNKQLNLFIALVAGLILGGVGSAMLDNLDSSVRTPEDIEGAAQLEVVGMVPRIPSGKDNARAMLLGKESFRGIRTNIRFGSEIEPRTIAVTSAAPGEGKSTVAANLAITMAEQGSRVVIVDADLRKPQIHKMMGVRRCPGLSDCLGGRAEIADVVQRVGHVDGLDVIPAGSSVGNPPALLDTDRFRELLQMLESTYSALVIDTPPLLAVSDAGTVGSGVDGTLLVVRAYETNSEVVQRAVKQLRRLNARLLGVVLNGVSADGVDGRYGYSYYEDYYSPGDAEDVEPESAGDTVLLRSG